jgi:uncharacterized membrane protein
MNWFLIALINPIAHAFANHFDKYLISRYIKEGSVGALILFMTLFAVVALPVIYIIHPDVFATISMFRVVVLTLNGCLSALAVMLYFYAINEDEASYVAPFFQLIPVFGFALGYFILHETLTGHQILAAALIVLGGFLLSIELSNGSARIKGKLVLLMLGSSFFYAINAVIFKSIAIHQGFLDSLFWDMSGKVILGILLFLEVRTYREQFINLIRVNRFSIIGLSMINEILALVGEIALILAVLFAPVVLVQSVSGLQPAVVLIIGIIITLFFPKLGKESLQTKHLAQKIFGTIIITVGVFLL